MASNIESHSLYQESDLLRLPDDVLINILERSISKVEDITKLSKVCKRIVKIFDDIDSRIWSGLRNKMGYLEILDLSKKVNFLLVDRETKKASLFIEEIKNQYYKISASIKLLKINFSEEFSKKIEKQLKSLKFPRLRYHQRNKLIKVYLQLNKTEKAQKYGLELEKFSYSKEEPLYKYHRLKEIIETKHSSSSRNHEFIIKQFEAYPKLIKVCFQLNKMQEANDLLKKIENPYTKVLTQLHFLKKSPSKNLLVTVLEGIENMPERPFDPNLDTRSPYFYKAKTQIKFLKVLFDR